MKGILLFAFAFPSLSFAQSVSDDTLMFHAAEEGMNNVQITNLVDYFHSKGYLQPSQRNAAPVNSQIMGNPGFENGTFFGWDGYIGDNQTSSYSSLNNLQAGIFSNGLNAPLGNSSARHTIVSATAAPDYYGNFPVVKAGNGFYAARLGGCTAMYQGEMLSQTWMVDPGTPYLKINYAVVLNYPIGHNQFGLPYFYYELKDAGGNVIDSLRILADDASLSTSAYTDSISGQAVQFCDWRSDSIPLTSYINTNITLTVIVAGCNQSAHFGYAYVDFDYPYFNSIPEESNSSFHIYPNPANDVIHIMGADNRSKPVITNMLGQEIEPGISRSAYGWEINMADQPKGIYFIRQNDKPDSAAQKIVLE